ncbi:MAG: hypothetical protein U1E53_16210 [Dongiaceae bacterium]
MDRLAGALGRVRHAVGEDGEDLVEAIGFDAGLLRGEAQLLQCLDIHPEFVRGVLQRVGGLERVAQQQPEPRGPGNRAEDVAERNRLLDRGSDRVA